MGGAVLLHQAVARLDVLDILLRHGADINIIGPEGMTILDHAMDNCWADLTCIKYFVENGASLDDFLKSSHMCKDVKEIEDYEEEYAEEFQFCRRAAAYAKDRRMDREAWRAYWETL